jgi:hypothetical protein
MACSWKRHILAGKQKMRALVIILGLSVACLAAAPARAQEGHPLKGSWLGTWAGNTVHGNDVVVILNWDGKAISGMINPGTDNIAIKNATLKPEGWMVHLEADAKDRSGSPVTYVIDGKIENLPLPNRSITGTWKTQKEGGVFKISRQ